MTSLGIIFFWKRLFSIKQAARYPALPTKNSSDPGAKKFMDKLACMLRKFCRYSAFSACCPAKMKTV